MKFKLKASAQDWLIFGIFAVIALFVIAILVNNMASVGAGEGYAGLNPIPAFIYHLDAVLLFYFLGLAGLIIACKSYFFEKTEGFGFSIGKKDSKGYSDWCKPKEMKSTLKEVKVKDEYYEHAGFPLINDGEKMWVDDGESHNLVIGSTGTGKTQCIIHPLVKILAKKGESMVITDPKGEIYRESASLLKERGYKIVILNFREPQRGNTWNPLALPYSLFRNGNSDKAMELLDDLAANILYEEGGSKDPFWEKTAADYFSGLTLGLFEDAKPEEVNINSVSLMTTQGEEKYGPRSTYIKEYFNDKDPAGAAYTCASGTVYAPEETKGSIISTMKQKIRLFASRENLSEMLASSDFDMEAIGREKTAVFMIIQDEKKTYHALATIFIKQVYESLIDTAQNSPKGELPVRTNFILDEFQNMPPLKDVTTMITAARSRRIRFTMIIQNFAGLDAVYGKENAQTIRSNCNNLLYLLTTELSALKEISELCGEKKVKVGKGDKEHEETRPLATVADLQRMKQFEAIVKRVRLDPFKTRLKPNFEIDWGVRQGEADPFVQREKQPIHVFNLKDFVQEKRKDKFMGMMDNNGAPSMGGPNPFAGPAFNGPNPFAAVGANPFMANDTKPATDNFNVDDLVKRIDAKIAELEAEERAEAEKKKQMEEKVKEENKQVNLLDLISENNNENKEELTKDVEVIKTEEKPMGITMDNENKTSVSDTYQSNITDDQFFDDFFDE